MGVILSYRVICSHDCTAEMDKANVAVTAFDVNSSNVKKRKDTKLTLFQLNADEIFPPLEQ